MNLYSFSQQNNDEMGILVKKNENPELYTEILNEAMRILTVSDEIRVSVKKVFKKPEVNITTEKKKPLNSNEKKYTTKEISKATEISSRKINAFLVDNKLMYKKDDDWNITKKGKDFGGFEKQGQYGKFVIWTQEIVDLISEKVK
jgi:beta-N-acetylglucosaminidase